MTGRARSELFAAPIEVHTLSESQDPLAARGYHPSDADFDQQGREEVKSRLRETGYADVASGRRFPAALALALATSAVACIVWRSVLGLSVVRLRTRSR
jgi:hypothetical protein